MTNILDLPTIQKNIDFLSKLYDYARLVNPVNKQIIDLQIRADQEFGAKCFEFWERQEVCSNCISARAYIEKKSFLKIDYNGERVYLITALPVMADEGLYVLELLRDITESEFLEHWHNKAHTEIEDIVNCSNERAITDDLTRSFNRRYINERLPFDLVDSYLSGRHLAIIFLDIDCFKEINDTLGHVAGDQVLIACAQELQDNIRKGDWVARYGGDEFLICLHNADAEIASKAAERIIQSIANLIIKFGDQAIKITASMGICSIYGENMTAQQFIECADQALYTAKNTGRNKVVLNK